MLCCAILPPVAMLFRLVFLARRREFRSNKMGFNGDLPLVYIQAAGEGGKTNEREREIRPNHYFSIDRHWQW